MNTNKTPTAKEFVNNYEAAKAIYDFIDDNEIVREMMIAFAKLHVKAALQAASEIPEAEAWESYDEESLLKAYPEENIK